MSDILNITIDGKEISAKKGSTIIQAADEAGVYIPRLCYVKKLKPGATCRLCTVMVNNRPVASCTQPVADGMIVENESEQLFGFRKNVIEMMFVEGNHFCMFCEKSGNCELQALGYRFGVLAPKYPFQFPKRELDASHPDVFLDRNRCTQCGRCVRASRDVDGKNVFQFVGRGSQRTISVNSKTNLAASGLSGVDEAVNICPVGAIIRKRVGYASPIGKRNYDSKPIGSDIEARFARAAKR